MPLLISNRVLEEIKSPPSLSPPLKEWIGEVCGRVHDNNILTHWEGKTLGPRHLTYAVCPCNLGRISRFKELGIVSKYWTYLWEVI